MRRIARARTLHERYGGLPLGRFLSSWRRANGLNQREFAEYLGISPANLCDLEKRRKGISISKAAQIAEAIGCPKMLLVQMALQEQVELSGLDLTVEVRKRPR